MNCTKCGKPLNPGDLFCRHCGERVSSGSDRQQNAPVNASNRQMGSPGSDELYAYICPKCGAERYQPAAGQSSPSCQNCGIPLRYSGYSETQWQEIGEIKRNEVIQKIRKSYASSAAYSGQAPSSDLIKTGKVLRAASSGNSVRGSGIALLLKIVGGIVFAAFFIMGIRAGQSVGSISSAAYSIYGMFSDGYHSGGSGFSFSTALGVWAMGGATWMAMYAIAEIITILDDIRHAISTYTITEYNDPKK